MGLVIRPVAWAPRRQQKCYPWPDSYIAKPIHDIAKPIHDVMALRYVREEGGAPLVLSKGKELIAVKIREIAVQHSTPIIEDKHLARSMDVRVEVDRAIRLNFIKR